MNEAIIENYLSVIQDKEPAYMTEGLREFVAKFDRQMLKRTIEKLHMSFTKGDGEYFDRLAQQTTAKITKIPKYNEVKTFLSNVKEENPEINNSTELARKVLKNTFKIKDKAKLELLSGAVGMTAWVKTKGGRTNVTQATKETLKKIHTDVMSIYDTGFENMPANTPEEEELKKKMSEQAKKQEKTEMIIVFVILSILVAAIIWGGITVWGILTSPFVIGISSILILLTMIFKFALVYLGAAASVVIPALIYLKSRGA